MQSWDEEFRIIGFAFQGETMEQTNIVSKRNDPKFKKLGISAIFSKESCSSNLRFLTFVFNNTAIDHKHQRHGCFGAKHLCICFQFPQYCKPSECRKHECVSVCCCWKCTNGSQAKVTTKVMHRCYTSLDMVHI